MAYRKITHGFVTQNFDDEGNCLDQEFTFGDMVEYEDNEGNVIDSPDNEQYQPFHMVQPETDPENCIYCGTRCFDGEGCDEWQADGFND